MQRPSFTSAVSEEHASYKHCSDEIRVRCNHKLMSLPEQTANLRHCCCVARALEPKQQALAPLPACCDGSRREPFASNPLSAQPSSCPGQALCLHSN